MKQPKITTQLLRGGIFALVLTSLASCDAFKKAETTAPPKKPNGTTTPQGQANRNPNAVDTVLWKVDPAARPPIFTNTNGQQPTNSGGTVIVPTDPKSTGGGTITYPTDNSGGIKNGYELAIMLPFFSSQYTQGSGANPTKAQFALDFYAGVRLALDSLSTQPLTLKVNVLDSRNDINALLSRYEVSHADVILGPVEKENVPAAMDYSNRANKIVISPYFPTGDVEGGNPRFVQVKPSLKTHCEDITKHIRARVKTEQVVLVGRKRDNEVARFKFFQDANATLNQAQYGGRFEEWAIEDEANFNVESYIQPTGTTVFVVPSWSEPFVASFLRKLNASPRRASVVVYGMPQWMDFDKTTLSMYEGLRVRISSSTFIEGANPEVKNFRSKFTAKYGKMPNSDAFLGYDCMLYFGKLLMQYGTAFPQYLQNDQQAMLHTKFNFEPVLRTVVSDNDPTGNVSKYENRYVNMLKYQGGAFRLDE